MYLHNFFPLRKPLVLLALAAQLVACGGGSDGTATTSDPSATISTVTVTGSVGDGPIVGAQVSAYSAKGKLLATQVSDSSANYSVKVDSDLQKYPVIFVAEGGVDLVTGSRPDFKLLSVTMNPTEQSVNINPFSTLIVRTAQMMPGGFSVRNYEHAKTAIQENLTFGLDRTIIPDPITSEITSANVAQIVKASEAVGEMVRRSRDVLISGGYGVNGDAVIDALAADLSDGVIDGRGRPGVDVRISAAATVASAQVLVESLANNLRVGNINAATAMDNAIMETMPGANPSLLTGSVRVTQAVIEQARLAIDAVRALAPSTELNNIYDAISSIAVNSSPEQASAILPAASSATMDTAIALIPVATDAQLESIHTTMRNGGSSEANGAPTLSGTPPARATVGTNYSFRPTASDPENDSLTFSIQNRPQWATFNTTTGQLSGTPAAGDVGTNSNITISVTDGSSTDSMTFNVTVVEAATANRAPTIGGTPGNQATVGQAYSFLPMASDPDGDTLSFSIVNRPRWASFSATTGQLSGTPAVGDVGIYSNVTIQVTDGSATARMSFNLSVVAAVSSNRAPTISGSPATSVAEDRAYSFTPSAADPDGDPLTFSITNRPAWATFSSATGRLSGTPTNSNVGTTTGIVISVSDGTVSTALPAFNLTVTNTNDAPTISGSPATSVAEDRAYSFTPSADDADGNPLTFSITNRPAWATFNTSTGRLSGTPTNAHVGTTTGIIISVSDGTASAALPAFNLTVTNTNDAPTISGAPATTVIEGRTYSFQPSATDLDGDRLTYAIANRPAWATFDTATGRLSGTPGSSHVGTTSNIVISVSDGTTTAALPAFSITVTAAATQVSSVNLAWDAPVARVNGDALSMQQIGGYTVYYGTQQGSYPNSVTVDDAYTTQLTVNNLQAGTYYFVVTAFDTDGRESEPSNVATKVVQ